MDFKNILATLSLLALSACTISASPTDHDEDLIGVPLEKISTLSKSDGSDSEQIAIFDETTRKIHQFQLEDMTYLKSYDVPNPGGKHTVLVHDRGNYVVDFSEKNITVFSRNGEAQKNPVKIMGQPLSAAFSSDLNLLIIYDDLNNVGLLQMDPSGQASQSWVGGSLIANQSTIAAGDLLSAGRLVLALKDGQVVVADIAQTLAQKPKPKWIVTQSFNSGLSDKISWLAPVSDNSNQIFVKAGDTIAVFDITTGTQLDSKTLSGRVEKLSKSTDAHLITREMSNYDEISIYYVQSSKIQTRTLQKQGFSLFSSYLNLTQDQWSFVEASQYISQIQWTNDIDYSKQGRTLKMIQISDLAALQKVPVPDQTQALLSPSYLFTLYPSELGYAKRANILSGETREAKFFNVGHIQE